MLVISLYNGQLFIFKIQENYNIQKTALLFTGKIYTSDSSQTISSKIELHREKYQWENSWNKIGTMWNLVSSIVILKGFSSNYLLSYNCIS